MDEQNISSIAGAALSLILSYFPGISSAWEKLDTPRKRFWTGVLIVVTGVAVYGLSCAGVLAYGCDWTVAAKGIIGALFGNVGAFVVTKGGSK